MPCQSEARVEIPQITNATNFHTLFDNKKEVKVNHHGERIRVGPLRSELSDPLNTYMGCVGVGVGLGVRNPNHSSAAPQHGFDWLSRTFLGLVMMPLQVLIAYLNIQVEHLSFPSIMC